jgi:hypothetical protein
MAIQKFVPSRMRLYYENEFGYNSKLIELKLFLISLEYKSQVLFILHFLLNVGYHLNTALDNYPP